MLSNKNQTIAQKLGRKKTKQKNPETAYLKSHHNNPIYYHPFRQFLFISHIYILGQFLSPENLWGKQGSGSQAEDRKDDDKKVNITEGLCVDGGVPPYRILSYCTRVRNKVLGFHCFASSLPVMSSHVPRSKVDGSLVQMFLVFSCFAFTRSLY